MTCPKCGSRNVRSHGSKNYKETRVRGLVCRNPDCPREGRKGPQQFLPHTSGVIKNMIHELLGKMVKEIYVHGAKAKTVALNHGVSESFVSVIRDEVDAAIERGLVRDSLVAEPTEDFAVAIDETFFKIGKTSIYVIIVRGYKSRQVLGLNVSTSRKEEDIRVAFDEAQANTVQRIKTVTSDAWGATRAMLKHLMYPITHVIHKHQKPYDKVVIERVEYDGTDRIVTQVGIKADAFTERAKREYRYRKHVESTVKPPSKPRGRPKGSRNKPPSTKKNEP